MSPPSGWGCWLLGQEQDTYPSPLTWPGMWSWVDAGHGVAFASGTNVLTWADRGPWGNSWHWTGGGYNANSPNPTIYPTYVASAINGLPALQSPLGSSGGGNGTAMQNIALTANDGSTAYGSGLFLPAGDGVHANRVMCVECTVTVVAQSLGAQTPFAEILTVNNLSGPIVDIIGSSTQYYDFATTAGNRGMVLGPFANFGGNPPYILTCVFDGSTPGGGNGSAGIYANGVFQASATLATPTSNSNQPLYLFGYNGTSEYGFNGYVAEVIYQTQAVTAAQLKIQNRYLGQKYGIVVP